MDNASTCTKHVANIQYMLFSLMFITSNLISVVIAFCASFALEDKKRNIFQSWLMGQQCFTH